MKRNGRRSIPLTILSITTTLGGIGDAVVRAALADNVAVDLTVGVGAGAVAVN